MRPTRGQLRPVKASAPTNQRPPQLVIEGRAGFCSGPSNDRSRSAGLVAETATLQESASSRPMLLFARTGTDAPLRPAERHASARCAAAHDPVKDLREEVELVRRDGACALDRDLHVRQPDADQDEVDSVECPQPSTHEVRLLEQNPRTLSQRESLCPTTIVIVAQDAPCLYPTGCCSSVI